MRETNVLCAKMAFIIIIFAGIVAAPNQDLVTLLVINNLER